MHRDSRTISNESRCGRSSEYTRKRFPVEIPERSVELPARLAPDAPSRMIDRVLDAASIALSGEPPWAMCDEFFVRTRLDRRRLAVNVNSQPALPARRSKQIF